MAATAGTAGLIGSVAGAASSPDRVQAAIANKDTAAADKAVISFKESLPCFGWAESVSRASN